jgi:uncharacterized protein
MAKRLLAVPRNPITIPTIEGSVPFIVLSVTTAEEPAWLRPSPGLWRMRRAEVATFTAVGGAFFGLVFLATVGAPAALAALAVVLGLGAALSWFVRRRYRAWRYLERHEDLIVARGVMVQRLSVVPYGRMQFVELTAGPIERLFQLSTVKLHTAAAASDARIPGLERAEAARLRDRLTDLGESMAAGM